MAHKDILHITKLEDGRDLTIKDSTGTSTSLSQIVSALIIKDHTCRHLCQSKTAGDTIGSCDGNRQSAFVLLKVTIEFLIFGSQPF